MAGDIIYTVFVSSTYEDLREERAAVQKTLLQLDCMPIGMELFGSTDEETWEVIKRQIENCDYYVVIVADKYGSTAADGISYTEKEYDYARQIQKPVLAFIHGDRKSIPGRNTEDDPEKRVNLEAFIDKIRQRSPISFFTAPHELAKEVAVSLAKERERKPAIGFIQADRVPEVKRHIEVLQRADQSAMRAIVQADELAKSPDQQSSLEAAKKPISIPYREETPEWTIIANYVQYVPSDDYWKYVNLSIKSYVYNKIFSARGFLSAEAKFRERKLSATFDLYEVFRQGDFISLSCFLFYDSGGTHENFWSESKNFSGRLLVK